MARRLRTEDGFTLMELMIVVAILGILASIAIPTFVMMMNRSKTGEVSANLNSMFKTAASYYTAERAGQAQGATVTGFCTVDDAGPKPDVPKKAKQRFDGEGTSFKALGFSIADFVYYSYQLNAGTPASTCGHQRGESNLYTFSAFGDLDQDLNRSTFELAAGSDGNNTMYHAKGFFVVNELE